MINIKTIEALERINKAQEERKREDQEKEIEREIMNWINKLGITPKTKK